MPSVIGWDIGGVNTKAAVVVDGVLRDVQTRPFELQRAADRLSDVLADIAAHLRQGLGARETLARGGEAHAVTMTAELSQMFRTKRQGVNFVLDAVERTFPGAAIRVYSAGGTFLPLTEARRQPLHVASANWVATAHIVARYHRDAVLIDVGTTTTDIIPITDGTVVVVGRTDPARLASGELVYTGAVRTPVETVVRAVPVGEDLAGVSAEGFALTGDAHVWLDTLSPADYDATTPDGRPSTREFAGERLCRVVCADREMLDEAAITRIAQSVADAQVEQVADSIRRVVARHPGLTTAVVTGLGAFIGERAARTAGLPVVSLSSHLGAAGARSAPAAAVALLLDQEIHRPAGVGGSEDPPLPPIVGAALQGRPPKGLVVVKLGGSLLSTPDVWRDVIATIAAFDTSNRLVVVPGGGPFADRVRDMDARIGLSDTVAHWLAIRAMDQHADLIAAADARLTRVDDAAGVAAAHAQQRVPVLAPLAWLRRVDPLPHSWEVTSDSIAAWAADVLAAVRLVLIKPSGASGPSAVDRYFTRALPPDVPWTTCNSSQLAEALRAGDSTAVTG
jgi:probable H4MPT-linked C1 transfer pathway protein